MTTAWYRKVYVIDQIRNSNVKDVCEIVVQSDTHDEIQVWQGTLGLISTELTISRAVGACVGKVVQVCRAVR